MTSPASSSDRARPLSVAVPYITCVTVVAALVLAATAVVSGGRAGTSLDVGVVLLALLGALSIVFPIRFHHGGDVQGFNLMPAVLLAIAMAVPDPVALPISGLMAALGFAVATRSFIKTAFNTAQVVLAAGAALAAASLVAGGELQGDVLAPANLAGLAVGSVVFAAVGGLLMAELLHRISGTSRGLMLRQVLAPALWVTMGDFLAALLLTVLADRSPLAIVLALPMFVGLLLGYRGYAADREAGRQAQLLHGTSSQLLDGALDDDALQDAVGGLRDLLGAERAALAGLDDAAVPAWLSPVVDEVRRADGPVQRQDGVSFLACPVRLEGEVVGVLAVSGRRGISSWGPADLDLLSTVAGEIAATLRTRRLLAEVEHERARLAAETSKLTDVLASASDGIVVLDVAGRVEACNPAMTALLGVERPVVGLPWREVLHFEDEEGRPLVAVPGHPLVAALAGGTRVEGTIAGLRRPDGGLRWLRCSAAPVISEGESDGVVLVAVDLTPEREVEQLRADFIATVSHELRTPLTPLRGFLGVLREHGGQLDDSRREMMVTAMQKQVQRLSDLIANLLQVAEVDGGLAAMEPEPVPLATAMAEVLRDETLSDAERARVTVELGDEVVRADRVALRRILGALVGNGLKHTAGMVEVTACHRGGAVQVHVRDEGPGVPEEAREVVFEPFRRLGNHLHRTQGPGLGLAVARSLAEALGGSLVVTDAPSGGADFVLRLPVAASHEAVPTMGDAV